MHFFLDVVIRTCVAAQKVSYGQGLHDNHWIDRMVCCQVSESVETGLTELVNTGKQFVRFKRTAYESILTDQADSLAHLPTTTPFSTNLSTTLPA